MVGDWLWQATSETYVFVFHIFVFLCLYLFRILCGKQAGGKTMVGDGLWHPRGETSPTFALLHFCLESIWVVSLDRVQLSYVFGPSPFRLYFFCDHHTNVHSLHLIVWIWYQSENWMTSGEQRQTFWVSKFFVNCTCPLIFLQGCLFWNFSRQLHNRCVAIA